MGELSDDELYRAVLDVLGLKRLTDNVRSVLSDALKLVADTDCAYEEGQDAAVQA